MTDEIDSDIDMDGGELTPEVETPEATEPMSGGADEAQTTASEQEDKPKEPMFSEEGQQLFNTKMAEEKRAKRELEAKYEQQLKDLQAQVPQQVAPVSSDIPNQYDFDTDQDYHNAVNQWRSNEQAVIQNQERQRLQGALQQRQQQQEQQRQQEEMAKTLTSFSANAVKAGVEEGELNEAVNRINDYGIDQNIGMGIMQREDGGLITKYLANNPQAIDQLNSAGAFGAGQLIAQIAGKAAKLKPQQSSAPKPADTLDGSGVGEKIHPLLDGVTFE